jgi:photosystem II stability/assembly factor-like uncharacterized protein
MLRCPFVIVRTAVLAPLVLVLLLGGDGHAQWNRQESGTKARLRGLCVVSPEVAWASGTGGTFVRTTDGGRTWQAGTVLGASALDFRDVHAVDANTAYLLSIGPGDASRIYKTTDVGVTWALQYKDPDPKVFLDALAFWDAEHGLALGDPVDGRFVVLATEDGGKAWKRIPAEGMPPALSGEGAFAASGTCLVVQGDGQAWFGTGGAKVSRVFRSTDRGRTWAAHETTIRAGAASAGIFSLAFRDGDHGIAVGGDYQKPEESGAYVALTTDGGRTWQRAAGAQPAGYRSAVAFLPGTPGSSVVAVGPTGSDDSPDGGTSWHRLGTAGFHAVGFAGAPAVGWAVGDDGLIARFRGERPGRR